MLAKKPAIFLLTLFFLLPLSQPAQANPANCYLFDMESPDMAVHVHERKELWCYEKLEDGTYVYNADQEKVVPELAFIVRENGILSHGSYMAGETTYHRVQSKVFNPFSVPTEEPQNLTAAAFIPTQEFLLSARSVHDTLIQVNGEVENLSLVEGEATAATAFQPWRGYWWPYRGQPLSNGTNSPFGKYDRFVQNRTGSNPGAMPWENSRHRFKGVWWEGHCNGWAAAAILRPEPRFSRRDPRTGITFTVSDQKGYLSEMDYCARVSFYGRRNYGRPGDDIRDPNPSVFHRTLTYYIGNLRKPIAFDYRRDPVVDTHIISGYTFNTRRIGPNTMAVTAQLRVHKYDQQRTDVPGIAPTYTRTYHYNLQLDSSGNPVGGHWTGNDNPDFMWVPLSPGNCSRNNSRIQPNWVQEILRL